MRMDGAALALLVVYAVSGFVLVMPHQICYIESEFDPTSNNRHRWVLPFKDPCECSSIRLGGMTVPSNRQGALYLDNLFLSEDRVEVKAFFNCEECVDPEPLGLEDGSIPDFRISAASNYFAGQGRLNGEAWRPLYIDIMWLDADLGVSTVVSGVITQGGSNYRDTQYIVRYKKLSSSDFDDVLDHNGTIMVFNGNTENTWTPITNMFDQSIVANIVRIVPVAYWFGIALRLELLGCYTEVE